MRPLRLDKVEAVTAVTLGDVYQGQSSPFITSTALQTAYIGESQRTGQARNRRDYLRSIVSSEAKQSFFSNLRASKETKTLAREYHDFKHGATNRLARFTKFRGTLAGPGKTMAGSQRRPASGEKAMAER
ncbi:hypothetical protein B0A54_13269 [Friedmanniomyces endolithicus]|uniref:Uncharacterized protein n=1 Tax=Friedmanniomyces endolithicus TaxID=329885 RepID=A0A4U0UNA1_9PEZI|nr:hypothetical protein B0A54_13269 [Friedmanniomyces endolithicus]